jgi:hydroxymethylglutaryl-CoA lyase
MKIIECPRDAMQGLATFIPTESKIRYLNSLLQVGFDTIDFGSFVSPKAIPQLRDTAQVIERLEWKQSNSKLLAIVANVRGAEQASVFDGITYLGFPLSISETFQIRNTNKSIADALNVLAEIKNVCDRSGKQLVSYVSMGFGNPFGDPYDQDMVAQFTDILITLGADVIALADTIGVSDPESIRYLFSTLSNSFSNHEIGVHLHSTPSTAREKIQAAFEAGCKRFDGALKGYGGCPMAKDELTGNVATEQIISFLQENNAVLGLNEQALRQCLQLADEIFPKH